MPPISRLSPEQAMYYFLSGYTSKLAGTEKGVGSEPQTTFSTCFGAPFLPLQPSTYARLLREKLSAHKSQVWMLNTGWTGGPYGIGSRIHLPYTRAMITAVLNNELEGVLMRQDPFFGVSIPTELSGVPAGVLDPRSTWSDPAAYDNMARNLIQRFQDNFEQFRGTISEEVVASGPALR
jgi:phosphoenolpyruvate carboxykinase (ATP)